MKPLQARLALIATAGCAFLVGFGFLGFKNFQDYSLLIQQIQVSSVVVEKAQSLFKDGRSKPDKAMLLELAPKLEPTFRGDNLKRYAENQNKSTFLLVLDSETRFQKYALEIANAREKRVVLYGGLAIAFCIAMTLIFLTMNKSWIFSRLQVINRRMLEFLQNKYSYEFETPQKNELGDLEQTFNMMAQRVLDQIEALKKLDTAKSEFLSIASHELRTPLTSIKGSLALMQAGVVGEVNEASKNLMNIALTETERLIRLINDLLDLAKIEAGGFSMNQQWVSAKDLISKTAAGLEGFAASAKVSIKVVCQNPIEGFLDVDRTQQVITNLASNAIKFSPEGSTVVLRASIDDNQLLRVEVIDQGPGIAPQDQELIFEKFRQATGPDNPLVKGTGLGLAIAKGLVEEQGGTIHVTSAPKEGSTFYFVLPKWRLQAKTSEQVA